MTFKTTVVRSGPRPLNEIAEEIADDYDDIGVTAAEALDALKLIEDVSDRVYDQTGREIVRAFLASAKSYRYGQGRVLCDELERCLRA